MIGELAHIIIDALLGGGLLVTLVTLGSTRKKAQADARQANAAATAGEVEGAERLLKAYEQYIIAPIRVELLTIRNEVQNQNKALAQTAKCSHVGSCPVVAELREQSAFISDGVPTPGAK